MERSRALRRTGAAALALAIAFAVLAPWSSGAPGSPSPTGTSSNAANKAAVAGGNVEEVGPFGPTTLLSTTMKTSPKADLIFQVTLECALWTQVTTVGNAMSEAHATVEVWVEMDGKPILTSTEDEADGRVVFCDRLHRQTTSDFDDEDATITNYLATRSANAFNWVAFDVGKGSGTHKIELKAQITGDTIGEAVAEGAVGARTLVVETLHMANGQ